MNSGGLQVVVRSANLVARDVRQIQLARGDGSALPGFTPGAHVDLRLGPGLVRQYSLCGEMDDSSTYTVAVKLEPQSRGGSRMVHERLQPGMQLEISPPRNNFPLDFDATHSVLVAGGIGITPLVAMARALVRRDRNFELHYFARSREHAAFVELLQSEKLGPHSRFYFGLDHEHTAGCLRDLLANRASDAQLYLCGPRAFMDTVRETAAARGWPSESVHLEYFSAGDLGALPGGDKEIQVTLVRTGRTIPVAGGTPIIDALRCAGVHVETSCEQGVCGTCITKVLDGIPEHHDLFLTDAEKASGHCMAICVSRAITPHLVLDL
jgi:vanillate monooxygenase ferredoxin subunit